MYPISRDLKRVIDQFGFVGEIHKPNHGVYDPATGTLGSGTPLVIETKMYFSNFTFTDMMNDSVVQGSRQLLIPHLDTSGNLITSVEQDDVIVGKGDKTRVVQVQEMYNADSLICYICQVRE